jgi:hypothetical protein
MPAANFGRMKERNMNIEIKNRYNGSLIFECEALNIKSALALAIDSSADLSFADLRSADLSYTNLSSADLRSADLRSADLRSANLLEIREDFFQRLNLAIHEVSGLYKAVRDGRIEGSTYEGKCACFVGTVANVRGVKSDDLKQLIGLKKDAGSPTERWFRGISKGDIPESNPVSRITSQWIEEFSQANGIVLPKRSIVWSDV